MDDLPPVLDGDDVPFEKPKRFRRAREAIKRASRKREKPPSDLSIGALAFAYFGGALAVFKFDQGFLLSAWLAAGPLYVTIYMTFEGRGSLLNPYTLFFATVVIACIGAHFATA